MEKKWIVFCDFDGTITEKDMIITIMEEFGRPGWNAVVDDIVSGRISIQDGVGQIFAQIPSREKEKMVEYALQVAKIRPGFAEFLQFCQKENIDFLVTSGGIDFFLKPILSPYLSEESIFCNNADFSGRTIRILWPHGCDESCDGGCGLCKPAIMRQYPAELYHRIVIGDSVSDWKSAQLADHVFARSLLLERSKEFGLPHTSFSTFFDVTETMEKMKNGSN